MGWSVTPDGEGFAYAKRHRKTLNALLGTHIAKSPSDSMFRWPLSQLDVEGFECLLQQWITVQPGVPEVVDTLGCDGKTLWGSIAETSSGAARFIAQVSLYSNSLGVAIAQNTYATDGGSEIKALRELLDRVELEGLLVQADALHANRLFAYLERRGADFLIAVRHSLCKGSRVIRDRLTYGSKTLFECSHRERKRGRDLTWTLRGMAAPEWAEENWPGSATLLSLAMNALRLDGFWSITDGLAALAHDIPGLLALLGWREQPQALSSA